MDFTTMPPDSAWGQGGEEYKAMEAELRAWIDGGAQPWELPASAVHFVLGCHGAESNRIGTADALAAVSVECEECGGEGSFCDDSHPANHSEPCETCRGHGVLPAGQHEAAARAIDAFIDALTLQAPGFLTAPANASPPASVDPSHDGVWLRGRDYTIDHVREEFDEHARGRREDVLESFESAMPSDMGAR